MRTLSHLAAAVLLTLAACTTAKPIEPARPHTVVLTWQASPKATSYNIYRASGPTYAYEKIGSSPTTTYSDSAIPGRSSVFYKVSSVNKDGESELSPRIVVSIP